MYVCMYVCMYECMHACMYIYREKESFTQKDKISYSSTMMILAKILFCYSYLS